jgi:hypothetical protein
MEILSSSLFGGGRQIKICLDLENGSFQMMNNICDETNSTSKCDQFQMRFMPIDYILNYLVE